MIKSITLASVALMLISFVSVLQLSCTDYKTATNPQNHAPVIEKVDYNKTTYHNRPVTIECIAGDIDGDDLTYSWVAGDGIISGQGKSVIWTPPGRMENYPIDLTVSDGKGGEAKDRIYIMVVTNADGSGIPNIEIKLVLGDNNTAQIENQRVGSWSTADIFCTVDNATGSNLVYRWSADCGRIKEIDGQNNKLNRISWIAPGTQSDCTVNVTVTDVQDRREAKGKVMFRVFCCGKELYGE